MSSTRARRHTHDMTAFILQPANPLLSRRNRSARAICRAPQPLVRTPPISNVASSMSQKLNDEAEDGDDGTMGRPTPNVGGFRLPPLSADDKAYLDGATSDRDFMDRMARIARRMDTDRQEETIRLGRQTPDDYIESLSQPPASRPVPEPVPPPHAAKEETVPPSQYAEEISRARKEDLGIDDASEQQTDDPEADIGPMGGLDERIEHLKKQLLQVAEEEGEDLVDEPQEQVEKKVDEVKAALRANAGVTEADLQAKHENVQKKAEKVADEVVEASRGKPEVVDRQIDYLENYLEKLKREEDEDDTRPEPQDANDGGDFDIDAMAKKFSAKVSKSSDIMSQEEPKFAGLGDMPGAMSEEEKIVAFEAIRRQAQQRAGMTGFADPLAESLPTRSTEKPEARPTPSRPQPGMIEEEDESFFAIMELEVEIKKYLYDAKALLEQHEAKMQKLLGKLREG